MAKNWNPAYQKGKSRAGIPGKVGVDWYDYHDNDYAYTDRQTPHFLDFKKIGNQTLVDDSRDWKTKYYSDRGFAHNLQHGLNMSNAGRYFTGHSRTGWHTDEDGYESPKSSYWAGKQWEILDLDAYNRDAVYKSALQKRYGSKKTFKTPQDILDAEAVMSGSWKPAPPPPPPKPPAPPKQEVIKDVLGNPVTTKPPVTIPTVDPVTTKPPVTTPTVDPVTTKPDVDLGKWENQEKLSYEDFAGWMKQYNTANPTPQPQQLGYNDFADWMNQYNTNNPVVPPPPPKDTFSDFMGYMKQYNMMSGPRQQQAPAFGYGVGGTASGGVQSANPYQSFANFMQQFQAINPPEDEPSVTSSLLNI